MLTATSLRGGNNPLDGNQPYDLEGNCGLFARNVEWTINQTTQRQGIIFQLVKRSITAQRYDNDTSTWVPLGANAVDAYVGPDHATGLGMWSLYWEAWRVNLGQPHPTYPQGRLGRADDCFGLTALIPAANHATSSFRNTTKGTYTMVGAAFMMVTDKFPLTDFQFSRNNGSPAGAIPSHIALGYRLLDNMNIDSDIIRHRVVVTWDSTVPDPEVEEPGDGDYGVSHVIETLTTVNRATVRRSLTPVLT